jgi:FKBP-type peptidyl-prolyl cis-trans isomerase FkpA
MKTVKILAVLALFAAISTKAYCQDYQTVDGLKYKIFNPHKGPKPQMGDKAMCDLLFYGDNDTLVYNSIEKHQIIPIPIQKSQFTGDLMEGIKLMSVGDSAIFFINGDSVAKLAGPNGHIKPGSKLKYIVILRSISNDAEQARIDENIIKDYIKANKIEGMKRTDDGLYYKITAEGAGDVPTKGQNITAHYTGKGLDGKVFDSDANRPGPGLSFTLGYHQVISGWDEAFSLMKKGAKATLLIPSKLAYGAAGNPPVITPNEVLLFDVELVDIKADK